MKLIKYILVGIFIIPVTVMAFVVPFRTQTICLQALTSKDYEPPINGVSTFLVRYHSKLRRVEIIGSKIPVKGTMVNIMLKSSLTKDYFYYLD